MKNVHGMCCAGRRIVTKKTVFGKGERKKSHATLSRKCRSRANNCFKKTAEFDNLIKIKSEMINFAAISDQFAAADKLFTQ